MNTHSAFLWDLSILCHTREKSVEEVVQTEVHLRVGDSLKNRLLLSGSTSLSDHRMRASQLEEPTEVWRTSGSLGHALSKKQRINASVTQMPFKITYILWVFWRSKMLLSSLKMETEFTSSKANDYIDSPVGQHHKLNYMVDKDWNARDPGFDSGEGPPFLTYQF